MKQDNGSKIVLTVLLVFGLVFFLAWNVSGGRGGVTPLFPRLVSLYDVVCSVGVSNPFGFSAAKISSVTCVSSRSSSCFGVPALSVFGASGGIHLLVGGKESVESFEVGTGIPLVGTPSSVKKSVGVDCVRAGREVVVIKLVSDDNEVLDERRETIIIGG